MDSDSRGRRGRARNSRGSSRSAGGLRLFSLKVVEKIRSRVRTTYNAVANELVSDQNMSGGNARDGKSIRRRCYDAINVLLACGLIMKDDKKQIVWRGHGCVELDRLRAEVEKKAQDVEQKKKLLQDMERKHKTLEALLALGASREADAQDSGCGSGGSSSACSGSSQTSQRYTIPFMLVQAPACAKVHLHSSEDRTEVQFELTEAPPELHDDCSVVMRLQQHEAERQANQRCRRQQQQRGVGPSQATDSGQPTPPQQPAAAGAAGAAGPMACDFSTPETLVQLPGPATSAALPLLPPLQHLLLRQSSQQPHLPQPQPQQRFQDPVAPPLPHNFTQPPQQGQQHQQQPSEMAPQQQQQQPQQQLEQSLPVALPNHLLVPGAQPSHSIHEDRLTSALQHPLEAAPQQPPQQQPQQQQQQQSIDFLSHLKPLVTSRTQKDSKDWRRPPHAVRDMQVDDQAQAGRPLEVHPAGATGRAWQQVGPAPAVVQPPPQPLSLLSQPLSQSHLHPHSQPPHQPQHQHQQQVAFAAAAPPPPTTGDLAHFFCSRSLEQQLQTQHPCTPFGAHDCYQHHNHHDEHRHQHQHQQHNRHLGGLGQLQTQPSLGALEHGRHQHHLHQQHQSIHQQQQQQQHPLVKQEQQPLQSLQEHQQSIPPQVHPMQVLLQHPPPPQQQQQQDLQPHEPQPPQDLGLGELLAPASPPSLYTLEQMDDEHHLPSGLMPFTSEDPDPLSLGIGSNLVLDQLGYMGWPCSGSPDPFSPSAFLVTPSFMKGPCRSEQNRSVGAVHQHMSVQQ